MGKRSKKRLAPQVEGRPNYRESNPSFWPEMVEWAYSERDKNLRRLGYRDYATYLRSDKWADIRERAFKRWGEDCLCTYPATAVHHAQYDLETLAGGDLSHLYPICSSCHEQCEFSNSGNKKPPSQATLALFRIAKKRRERNVSRLAEVKRKKDRHEQREKM